MIYTLMSWLKVSLPPEATCKWKFILWQTKKFVVLLSDGLAFALQRSNITEADSQGS
jgi:hypothetical protein